LAPSSITDRAATAELTTQKDGVLLPDYGQQRLDQPAGGGEGGHDLRMEGRVREEPDRDAPADPRADEEKGQPPEQELHGRVVEGDPLVGVGGHRRRAFGWGGMGEPQALQREEEEEEQAAGAS
jgi:hypothetical protein